MPNGTVKFFNATKGFGFITSDEGGKDIFLPKASVSAAGLSNLKTALRVTFEVAPDVKGPKAIHIKVLENFPQQAAPIARPAAPPVSKTNFSLTIYIDAKCVISRAALADLRALDHEPQIVDYIVTPLSCEQLKELSMLVRNSGGNLVRKYDALFQELRLDDRFISDAEFWTGIFEHPTLINGPILATATRAITIRAGSSIGELLSYLSGGNIPASPKPKREAVPVLNKEVEASQPLPSVGKIAVKKNKERPAKGASAARKRKVPPKSKSEPGPAVVKSKPNRASLASRSKAVSVSAKPKTKIATKGKGLIKTKAKAIVNKKPGSKAKRKNAR